jgi:hypothetical protein
MCLIIYKPDNAATFTAEHMLTSIGRNSDGVGVMYAKDGRVIVEKIEGTYAKEHTEEEIAAWCNAKLHEHDVIAMHHRMTTHGNNCLENIHPYKVTSIDDGDEADIYMMHNGIIQDTANTKLKVVGGKDVDVDYTPSDTQLFVTQIVRPLLKAGGVQLIHEPAVQELFEKYIGVNNKLLFMDGEGQVVICNESAGTWQDTEGGCWISNTYSINSPVQTFDHMGWGFKPKRTTSRKFNPKQVAVYLGWEIEQLLPSVYNQFYFHDNTYYQWNPDTKQWLHSTTKTVVLSRPKQSNTVVPPKKSKGTTGLITTSKSTMTEDRVTRPKEMQGLTTEELIDHLCISTGRDSIMELIISDVEAAVDVIELLLEDYFQNSLQNPVAYTS